jgi:hypothetical protein
MGNGIRVGLAVQSVREERLSPRGRKSSVRYYFDSITGSVIAVAKEGIRVLEEILPGAEGQATTGKRRGRSKKAST